MREQWDLSGVSCLIAEDHPHMRTILRSVLSGFGIRTLFEAGDGAEALELVVDRRPDIVLCDWSMPMFGGSEFLRILRADRDRILSTTPVLVVSAHARRATILEAIENGIHGFVAKPIAPVILYQHIGGILERQRLYGRTRGIARPGTEWTGRESDTLDLSGMAPSAERLPETGMALL
ncbi:response regulator [Labrenzia sp. 011]|uniref:response regulator n=1 Tax=Labrenzia sp. 011 TaxID=2171494 RepID=UPI001AD940D8|nr:response regulator [Labrenzia sp. 011]